MYNEALGVLGHVTVQKHNNIKLQMKYAAQ